MGYNNWLHRYGYIQWICVIGILCNGTTGCVSWAPDRYEFLLEPVDSDSAQGGDLFPDDGLADPAL